METKTLNQKKKELFALLVEYYSLKPEDKWCTGSFTSMCGNKHCGVGFLMNDFDKMDILNTVSRLFEYQLVAINDGVHYDYKHIPTPKGRVIAYLEDEIKKLS